MTLIIPAVAAAGLWIIYKTDPCFWVRISCGKKILVIMASGTASGALLRWIFGREDFLKTALIEVFAGCLLLACITDLLSCRVHNFVWWTGAAPCAALLWRRLWECAGWEEGRNILAELTVFWLIQLFVFAKLYGKADCYAFCVCAVAEAGLGMGAEAFAAHMSFAYLLFVPVQIFKKNAGAGGRLIRPAPFVPYIAFGFLLVLIFNKICHEMVVPPF